MVCHTFLRGVWTQQTQVREEGVRRRSPREEGYPQRTLREGAWEISTALRSPRGVRPRAVGGGRDQAAHAVPGRALFPLHCIVGLAALDRCRLTIRSMAFHGCVPSGFGIAP